MKFIDKLERKFGNRGIENLTIYIIVSYVLGYALMFLNPELLSMLTLNVTQILHGQIWRLITWVNRTQFLQRTRHILFICQRNL